ncbi:MAG: gamma-glutamylcyclotransferase family protein [Bdellovibrionia bacterium]
MSEETLFVYGSLTQGMVHYSRIAGHIENQAPAAAQGSVYRLEVGFPVFVNQGTTPVSGILLTLKPNEVLGKLLDEFHGFSAIQPDQSLFLKTPIEVRIEGREEPVQTKTYGMNPAKLPRTAVLIGDGDWMKSLSERAPMTQGLTTNQKTYIQRLGRSTGRDIVPINLDLYRELMNKGLIVDKGRRLALTALGQEVYRYLE